MAEKQTFTYYLTIEIDAMNDESAMKKLEGWVEPTLALKKNADLNLTAIEFDEPEEEEGEAPAEEAKPSIVQAVMKKKVRPELKIPEKDDFDYDNIPDWDELGEDAPKKAKAIILTEDDDLGSLLAGLDDDEEEASADDDDDDDWDWDDDEEW
tara:strand:+ start:666 stop:1124 length:459 start_codon:yes stop_codon:yes gene_type:complete